MSHQDKDDLRTPVAELKELLAPIRQVSLDGISRHGNAWLDLTGVMITAILTFGWNQQQTLSDRFDDAQVAANRALGNVLLAGSFQALMVVLRACAKLDGWYQMRCCSCPRPYGRQPKRIQTNLLLPAPLPESGINASGMPLPSISCRK